MLRAELDARARGRRARTGVVPDAAMPTTKSFAPTFRAVDGRRAIGGDVLRALLRAR